MRFGTFVALLGLAAAASAQQPEYQGPSILSRGMGVVLGGGGELVRIRPFVGVNGIYDSGLTAVSVDSTGKISSTDAYGVEANFGALGYHTWRRTVLGLDYRGDFRHYNKKTYYDGTDHNLSLGLTHQMSRRWGLTLREAAGSYSRSFGPLSGFGFYNPQITGVPTNELFDGRTYYLSSLGDLTFQKSPRLSFNMGGSGMVVRRRSSSLVGVTGWSSRGDVAYRVNRSNVIGADYSFNHYQFTRSFGSSDIHMLAYNWTAEFGRNWQFGIRAGGARVETLGLRVVAVDPLIAQITGQSSGVEVFHGVNYLPSGEVRLSRSFQRSSVALSVNTGAGAGNGIYLTARQTGANLGYSYTASRRWNFGLSGNYNTYGSLGQNLGRYSGYGGGGGVTCQLSGGLHLVAHVDARQYGVKQSALTSRTQIRGTVGFAFSPGEFPLSLW